MNEARPLFVAVAVRDPLVDRWLVRVELAAPGMWALTPAQAREWAEALIAAADAAEQPAG